MLNKIWLVEERKEGKRIIVGGTDDEGYADRVIEALRSVDEKGFTYSKSCVDFLDTREVGLIEP